MAVLKSEESSPDLTGPSNCVDPLDIEQYINPESMSYPSPSISPSFSSVKSSTIATPTTSSQPFDTQRAEQTFSRPSHQYEQYKQQSSLPVGAVATTFALNETDRFYGHESYDMFTPTDGYFGMNMTDEYIDFGTAPSQTDVDMDFGSSSQRMPTLSSTHVSPAAVGGQEATQNSQPHSSPSQPMRAWPGMHQQAAMQAKAQAEAQAQRQQQIRQQSVPRSRAPSHTHQENPDPHVEESIARLLDRMRHSSVSSSRNGDNDGSDGHYTHGPRIKKDEEDMDEDERLLASEEGKKLSSKERRQLRNKVSARAFRSRRKEYIGQLEGELAAKATEADDLRIKNERLMAENTRLTDLTRMLLSSPHFSNFLNELSSSGGSLPSVNQHTNAQQLHQNQQSAPTRKDINPAQQSTNMHIGLAMIPESPYEFTATESTNNDWAPSNTVGFDQQVYAVTSIPEEPVIDTDSLSGKSIIEPLSSFGSDKDEAPQVEYLPEVSPMGQPIATEPPASEHDIDFDNIDPVLALYTDRPSASTARVAIQRELDPEDRIFGHVALEKAFERLELVIIDENADNEQELGTATIEKFERIRSRMDSLGARVEAAAGI